MKAKARMLLTTALDDEHQSPSLTPAWRASDFRLTVAYGSPEWELRLPFDGPVTPLQHNVLSTNLRAAVSKIYPNGDAAASVDDNGTVLVRSFILSEVLPRDFRAAIDGAITETNEHVTALRGMNADVRVWLDVVAEG